MAQGPSRRMDSLAVSRAKEAHRVSLHFAEEVEGEMAEGAITDDAVTALLAEQVMGWTVRPDRFVMRNRGWMPRWRFQPTEKLIDAFRLLEQAAPQEYTISGDHKGKCRVHVRIGDRTGDSIGISQPRAISMAIARALGFEINPRKSRGLDAG